MDSPLETKTSYSLAVVAVGVALVVLFAGAAVILAVGHQVPQEMWASASALSGALVGILIPTASRTTVDHAPHAAVADPHVAGANVPAAAKGVAHNPAVSGSTGVLIVIASLVLLLAFALALFISTGTIHAVACPLAAHGKTQGCDSNVLQIGTAALALASAAGGTLIGLFATPDGKPSNSASAKTPK
jgi:hypothetical protein